nr:ribonuclease H-like domain-containing protein [Tanacetum cinerariifolium]GEZ50630.1 ribonuclease H-like domain-containing protein [Tanacetum cinerariifolium]
MVRSLLITEEMRLKSKPLASPVDSSSTSSMVLLSKPGTSRRPSNPQIKSWRPCFNFAKGSCRLGSECRYVHDENANSNASNPRQSTNSTDALLIKLLEKLGVHESLFQQTQPSAPPGVATGPTDTTGQVTMLPQAFTPGTLHDPTTGTWNMDTGASYHLNNSVTSLITIFNSCMYPSVLVGDGHSIPVTNSGHNILPTTSRSLHLNNVLITPHIVKNLIFIRQLVHDNNCTIEFDSFGFSVKDFLTRQVLLRCDSTKDLYPVTAPSLISHAFL